MEEPYLPYLLLSPNHTEHPSASNNAAGQLKRKAALDLNREELQQDVLNTNRTRANDNLHRISYGSKYHINTQSWEPPRPYTEWPKGLTHADSVKRHQRSNNTAQAFRTRCVNVPDRPQINMRIENLGQAPPDIPTPFTVLEKSFFGEPARDMARTLSPHDSKASQQHDHSTPSSSGDFLRFVLASQGSASPETLHPRTPLRKGPPLAAEPAQMNAQRGSAKASALVRQRRKSAGTASSKIEPSGREQAKHTSTTQQVSHLPSRTDGDRLAPDQGEGKVNRAPIEAASENLIMEGKPSSNIISTPAPVKRGRGRPRKHPLLISKALPIQKAPKRRSTTGCSTCRRRKKKCDESKPSCVNCESIGVICEGYPKTIWKSRKERAEEAARTQRPSPSTIKLRPMAREHTTALACNSPRCGPTQTLSNEETPEAPQVEEKKAGKADIKSILNSPTESNSLGGGPSDISTDGPWANLCGVLTLSEGQCFATPPQKAPQQKVEWQVDNSKAASSGIFQQFRLEYRHADGQQICKVLELPYDELSSDGKLRYFKDDILNWMRDATEGLNCDDLSATVEPSDASTATLEESLQQDEHGLRNAATHEGSVTKRPKPGLSVLAGHNADQLELTAEQGQQSKRRRVYGEFESSEVNHMKRELDHLYQEQETHQRLLTKTFLELEAKNHSLIAGLLPLLDERLRDIKGHSRKVVAELCDRMWAQQRHVYGLRMWIERGGEGRRRSKSI